MLLMTITSSYFIYFNPDFSQIIYSLEYRLGGRLTVASRSVFFAGVSALVSIGLDWSGSERHLRCD